MLERVRRRRAAQEGFTLIELLVVVIIIGILAAIAIPSFLGQRDKANDSASKSLLRNAATAVETGFTDSQTYAVATLTTDKLGAIEPNIRWTTDAADSATSANKVSFTGTSATGYTLTSTSTSGNKYTYVKASGAVTRSCTTSAGASCGSW